MMHTLFYKCGPTTNNPRKYVVLPLAPQLNIVKLQLFGEFDYRTRLVQVCSKMVPFE